MDGGRRLALRSLFACFGLLFVVPPTIVVGASPLKVREAYPGSAAAPLAEYVELQMTTPGQADVDGQALRFYDGSGAETASYALPTDVANGQSQRRILFATAEASSVGASSPDFLLPSADGMSPAGGAVCFTGSAEPDCVAWGSAPLLGTPFPDPQAANATAVPSGQALLRTVAAGCPTFLDPADDTGSSATDFATASPSPQPNSTVPGETPCLPNTFIEVFPANPTNQQQGAFAYDEFPPDYAVTFECALDWAGPLDSADFAVCPAAGVFYPALADGIHRFAVRASTQGGTDATPDTHTWTVDTQAPETTIDATPASPSSGFAVAFSYRSSEPSSSFQCQLDGGAVQTCAETGKSYFGLGDGDHTFRVWATDNAENKDPVPAEHGFQVVSSLGDKTPPDTAIVNAPSDPSPTPEASFAYSSSEPGSSFECSLNGAPFSPCSAAGASYGGLRNARYTFTVRAIDRAGNVDSVPASYSWTLAAAPPDTRFTKVPPGNLRSRRGKPVVVAFRFASEAGATFRCRLDLRGEYKPCSSPYRFDAEPGRHVFEVFAVDRLGNEEGSPAFRIFRVQAPAGQPSFFAQSGRLLSSLTAEITPRTLPRNSLRPVAFSFASTFENLDGSDVPALKTMTLRLAQGGVVQSKGLATCSVARLERRSSKEAMAACGDALVGGGKVRTALRFPEGTRLRSTAKLLLFNAPGQLLMHVYATQPLEGTFVVPLRIRKAKGGFGTELKANFPRITAGFGQVTGFEMRIFRVYRARGRPRSYLLGNCPIPKSAGLNRISFELARVKYRFRGGLRIVNSTLNSCRVSR